MSSPEISQVLAQMRVLAARAQGPAAPGVNPGGFGELLQGAVNRVNELQQESGALKQAFELGEPDADLTSVMIASQKAAVSFQAMVQVRNKLVEAYKDVMNMSI